MGEQKGNFLVTYGLGLRGSRVMADTARMLFGHYRDIGFNHGGWALRILPDPENLHQGSYSIIVYEGDTYFSASAVSCQGLGFRVWAALSQVWDRV